MARLLFGMGTGRCGTTTLTQVLKLQQPPIHAAHEAWAKQIHWQGDEEFVTQCAAWLARRETYLAADVAFNWLPYVPLLAEQYPDARFVCLQRDREQVVQSFFLRTPKPWPKDWKRSFPDYGEIDRQEGLRRYWNDYYAQASLLADKYPQFRIFATDAFNHHDQQLELLEFCGVTSPDPVVGLKANQQRVIKR